MSSRTHSRSRAEAYTWNAEAHLFTSQSSRVDLPYSDGDEVENDLLALMRRTADRSLYSPELAAAIVDWPTRYHLNPDRANLLRPLQHLLQGLTLEVGPGCGALTRFMGELGGKVVALDGNRRRAEITAARCKGLDNVSVIHDRFERYVTDQRYNAITLVGVLEWASRFGDVVDGARRVLERAAALLDEQGVVILAIENQLGLKYFAGWPEDHLGVAMGGVNDSYGTGDPRTWGLGELTALLTTAGLAHHAVLTPFPDYKFPQVVVSPAGLADRGWSADLAALTSATPALDPQAPALPLFSMEQALELVTRNGLLPELANSFLIVASRLPVAATGDDVLAWHYSGQRRPQFRHETRFRTSPDGVTIERRPTAGDAEALAPGGRIRHRAATQGFVNGTVWVRGLGAVLNRRGWTIADVASWAAPWRDALASAAGLHRPAAAAPVPAHLVDATPFNLVVDAGQFRFFDLEWEPSWRVEYGYALFRGVFWSLCRFRSVAPPAEGVPLTVRETAALVAESLGTPLSPADVDRYLDLEADLQHETSGVAVAAARHSVDSQRLQARLPLESIAGLQSELESLKAMSGRMTAHHEELERLATEQRARHEEAVEHLREESRQEAARRDAEQQARSSAHAALRGEHESLRAEHGAMRAEHETLQAEHGILRAEHETLQAEHGTLQEQLVEAATERGRSEATRLALAIRIEAAETARRTTGAELRRTVKARNILSEQIQLVRGQQAALAERLRASDAALAEEHRRASDRQRSLDRVRVEAEASERRLVAGFSTRAGTVVAVPPSGASLLSRLRRLAGRVREARPPVRWMARNPWRFLKGAARLRHREYRQRVNLLRESGLFDREYYRRVTGAGPHANMVARFVLGGDKANESPHPLFDPEWYRQHNPDIPAASAPMLHYLRFGGWELRSPHPLFDARHYVAQWPEGSVEAATPLSHFLRVGWLGAASPHVLFDVRYYAARRPDLARGGVNPLLHYLVTANAEQLDPHPLFSTAFYLETNPGLQGQNPLDHFVRSGAIEGRSPHPLFDIGYYWAQRPDVCEKRENALVHYLHFGWREGVNPHPLFDTNFYLDQAPELRDGDLSPLVHFLRWGWQDGLCPSAWFDPAWYRHRNPDVVHVNPLLHFATQGWREGRDPSPQFSLSGYLERNPDVATIGANPLEHYLRFGRKEGRASGSRPLSRASTRSVALDVAGRANAGPTVLCVSHVSPWPVGAGNEYRLARLLQHLKRQGYRIVLVLSPLPGEPLAPGALDHLAAEYGNVVVCDRAGQVEFRFTDHPDVLSRLSEERDGIEIGPSEPGPDLAYCHDVLVAVVKTLADSLGTVAVLAEYIFMTRIFPVLKPGTLRIVDTHDVFSQKASNVVAYGYADSPVPAREEARLLRRADLVMAIHSGDAEALKQLVPKGEVIVSGVDADVRTDPVWPDRPMALVPGSANALNLAGLRDFLRFAWPRVTAALPEAQLRVAGGVGRVVPPGTRGVVALGRVPDLGAEYASARVVINPTVAGTGLKIKTIEALAHLRPVVGWPHNRDGLADSFSPFVCEATDWHDFADQVVKGLLQARSPFDARAIRTIARELAPETVYRELDDRLARFFRDPVSSARDDES